MSVSVTSNRLLDFRMRMQSIPQQSCIYDSAVLVHLPTTIQLYQLYQTIRLSISHSLVRKSTMFVPQGSQVGPLLLILFINDVLHPILNVCIRTLDNASKLQSNLNSLVELSITQEILWLWYNRKTHFLFTSYIKRMKPIKNNVFVY